MRVNNNLNISIYLLYLEMHLYFIRLIFTVIILVIITVIVIVTVIATVIARTIAIVSDE